MNNKKKLCQKPSRGFVSTLMVIGLSLMMLAIMVAVYQRALSSQRTQKVTQVKVDIQQREQAFLNAVLSLAPQYAMEAMQTDSWEEADELGWDDLFSEAVALAEVDSVASSEVLEELELAGIIANPSNVELTALQEVVGAVGGEAGWVSSGVNRSLGSGFPTSLEFPLDDGRDAQSPLITTEKAWGASSAGYATLPYENYPDYNLIPFPDVLFPLWSPGELFVAKRNWWAFELDLGKAVTTSEGNMSSPKTYVLSIYEVPFQLPLQSSSFTSVGQHIDGSNWTNITVDGAILGQRMEVAGEQAFEKIASQRALDLSLFTGSVDGKQWDQPFVKEGMREAYAVNEGKALPVFSGGDAGRILYLSFNRGLEFYDLAAASSDNNRISPTGWTEYTHGASQCAMQLIVTRVRSTSVQSPEVVEFSYWKDGSQVTETFEIGVNWPDKNTEAGLVFPFQPGDTEDGVNCLEIKLEVLRDYLESQGADSLAVNHSLVVNIDYENGVNTVQPSFPVLYTDMGVILRDGEDLTAFEKGFSLVTNTRLYIADDLNLHSMSPPAGSTVPTPYYPPMSLFAPEKRYGVTAEPRMIRIRGQLGSLGEDELTPSYLMDFRSGSNEIVISDNIRGELFGIKHPDQLPPVYTVSWLVTLNGAK